MLSELIGKEGAYSNNRHDAGGETMWGITTAVARANGYKDAMADMSRDVAEAIYLREYFIKPGFDRIAIVSPDIANELLDTGVNMGVGVAGKFLQRSLNVLNKSHGPSPMFEELVADGGVGEKTVAALAAYLQTRGRAGERVLLRMLNSLQGVRYIEIAEARPANEEFVFGWFDNRVVI